MLEFRLKFILLCNGYCKDFVEFFKELLGFVFGWGWCRVGG